jgi:hypothetical protein
MAGVGDAVMVMRRGGEPEGVSCWGPPAGEPLPELGF